MQHFYLLFFVSAPLLRISLVTMLLLSMCGLFHFLLLDPLCFFPVAHSEGRITKVIEMSIDAERPVSIIIVIFAIIFF